MVEISFAYSGTGIATQSNGHRMRSCFNSTETGISSVAYEGFGTMKILPVDMTSLLNAVSMSSMKPKNGDSLEM